MYYVVFNVLIKIFERLIDLRTHQLLDAKFVRLPLPIVEMVISTQSFTLSIRDAIWKCGAHIGFSLHIG